MLRNSYDVYNLFQTYVYLYIYIHIHIRLVWVYLVLMDLLDHTSPMDPTPSKTEKMEPEIGSLWYPRDGGPLAVQFLKEPYKRGYTDIPNKYLLYKVLYSISIPPPPCKLKLLVFG